MFDIKWIRANAEAFDAAMVRRGLGPKAAEALKLDDERREAIVSLNEMQERRNIASKLIGQAKAARDEQKAAELMEEVSALKTALPEAEERERAASAALTAMLETLPNLLHPTVPDGKDEHDNIEKSRWGEPRKFNFAPKEHFDIGEALGLMDFEAGARLAGARFVVLRGALARVERALGQFMLDLHTTEHGFTEHQVPLLVRPEVLYGTGQLPKFAEDAFRTVDDRWLIPTSEVPLTNLVREQILSVADLPIRVTALTPCFRAEAGSAGRDTRGMLRQHQFNKVEMVSVTEPDKSDAEQERMLACAEEVLKRLELPYRVVRLCAGDMGATMQRTFDIEVWLPGQDTYREISSVSMAGDWQARRMGTRYRDADGNINPVHTLNGSGVAVGRCLIAVMENHQEEDGGFRIPDVLKPYLGGLERIGPAQ
ncbi:MAG: serine--tRNA ligase [Alphaproteobacteria bacterium]|nr:serine--tRNA ligase [Alphaproteobacteria bacterium]